jgi:outer membrane protein OmpA-like peptidoglycan-associated protein
LYVSYWRGNAWTRPVNLGSEINTAGNETFPYLHSDGTLFYASDGLGGLGGLDIFMATKVNGGLDSLWIAPYNLGAPFNTKYDDFGLIINKAQNEGYLSSNRDGGIGKDDIYHFKIQNRKLQETIPTESKQFQICVYDKSTNKRIENAQVFVRQANVSPKNNPTFSNQLNEKGSNLVIKLTPSSEGDNQYLLKIESDNSIPSPNTTNPQGEPFTTDEFGVFPYIISARQPYVLEVIKEGYASVTEKFSLQSLDGVEEFCVGLDKSGDLANNANNPNGNNPNKSSLFEKIHPQGTAYDPNYSPSDFTPVNPRLAGKVINKEYNRPLPTAIVTLLNRCTGEEETIKLKKDGTFDLTLECGCDYVLKTRKDNFQSLNKVIALSNPENCKKPIAALLAMNPNIDKTGNAVVALGGNTLYEGLKEGDIIELKNIFYDFDEYNIRPDASKDLDELAHIMGQLPSMEIELSSHTDARASDSYNNTLSNNRAKSAKAYLVAKGISENRIKAIGYGENRPKNNCRDGVECSEYEHQRNRRTEVFVTKFNPTEVVKIQYIDNTPTVVDPMRK